MKKEEFSFLSYDKETQIHGVKWMPDTGLKAIIMVVHGVTEHILRYENFAKYFVSKGIGVVGIDLLGHGKSISVNKKSMYFGPIGSWNFVLEDLKTCRNMINEEFGDISCYILGFSLGSFLTRNYVINYNNDFDGVILLGTGQNAKIELLLAKMIANKEAKKFGEDNSSAMIRKLTFDTYNSKFKPNRTKYDWLCSSEKSIDEYMADSLRGGDLSSGLFREMLTGMDFVAQDENVLKMNKDVPVLLLSGDRDAVGANGKGVTKVYNSFKKNGIKDVEMKLYPDLRHDILHEDVCESIYEDILIWLDKHFKK